MSKKETLLKKIAEQNGIITAADCRSLGIATVYLTRLERQGFLYKVEKGVYLTQKGDYDEFYFFQYRYDKPIFSYVSALYLQGFTDELPENFEVTVPRGYRFNQDMPNVQVHQVPKDISQLGVTSVETPLGNPVRVYDIERVICDFIKNRRNIDIELFSKTMKAYIANKGKNLFKLYNYAEQMKIADQVVQVMEVLL